MNKDSDATLASGTESDHLFNKDRVTAQAISITGKATVINHHHLHEYTNGNGTLPDNLVDSFSKSVHFLKHQSPDTKALDLAAFSCGGKISERMNGPDDREVKLGDKVTYPATSSRFPTAAGGTTALKTTSNTTLTTAKEGIHVKPKVTSR